MDNPIHSVPETKKLKREGFIRLTRGAEKSGKTSIAMKDPDTILSIIVLLLACLGLAALAQVIVS